MILTEEEAKKKWCPYSRVDGGEGCCLAPDCAAWRWVYPPESNDAAHCVGYCGLAGKPLEAE